MAGTDSTKVTYVTLAGDEAANASYEVAVKAVAASLGGTQPMWIDGAKAGTSLDTFEDVSPTDPSVVVARFPRGGPGDVARALEGAKRAAPMWAATPWPDRVAILRRAAEAISRRRTELAAIMSIEVGKNRSRRWGTPRRPRTCLRYYAQQIEDAEGFEKPLAKLLPGEDTRSVLRPYGVFAVVAPFNFPLALAAGMAGGALVAGNTVVFKPSSEAPLTGLRLCQILNDAGLRPGVFQLVTGGGRDLGDAFLDPRFDGIVFTGSKEVGLDLHRRFARGLAEAGHRRDGREEPRDRHRKRGPPEGRGGDRALGVRLRPDRSAARARARSSPHRCTTRSWSGSSRSRRGSRSATRPSARHVHGAAHHREGEDDARGRARRGPPGRPYRFRGEGSRRRAPSPGAHFVPPVVVDGLPDDHRIWRDELFAPLLAVAPTKSLDEAIARANTPSTD
jgi:1-pyrroline-5-carboxylate dehydrogenase